LNSDHKISSIGFALNSALTISETVIEVKQGRGIATR
jgi:hypothetical protein